jgi:hypothetical protein
MPGVMRLSKRPLDRAVAVMRAHARQRGEEDGGERGAERHLRLNPGGQALHLQQGDQHGHDDQPAADAEQPGDEAHRQAEHGIGGEKRRIRHPGA